MTVAIGLVCNDGVLVASDSMASEAQTAHDVTKVFKLDCCPVVWTAAGSVYVIEEVKTALAGIDIPNLKTGVTVECVEKTRDARGCLTTALREVTAEEDIGTNRLPLGRVADSRIWPPGGTGQLRRSRLGHVLDGH